MRGGAGAMAPHQAPAVQMIQTGGHVQDGVVECCQLDSLAVRSSAGCSGSLACGILARLPMHVSKRDSLALWQDAGQGCVAGIVCFM